MPKLPRLIATAVVIVTYVSLCSGCTIRAGGQTGSSSESAVTTVSAPGKPINGDGYSGDGFLRDTAEARRKDLISGLRLLKNGKDIDTLGNADRCRVDKDVCARVRTIAADTERLAYVTHLLVANADALLSSVTAGTIHLSDGVGYAIDGESTGWTVPGPGHQIELYGAVVLMPRALGTEMHEFGHLTQLEGKYWQDAEHMGGGRWLVKDVLNDLSALVTDYFDREVGAIGSLDATFQGPSISSSRDANPGEYPGDFVQDAQGNTYVAGSRYIPGQSGGDAWSWAIWKFLPNGLPDVSFGDRGRVTHAPFQNYSGLSGIALDTDGRLVVSGIIVENSLTYLGVARYLPDGAPDTSFGTNGLTRALDNGRGINGYRLVLQPDGKIVVATMTTDNGNNWDFGLVRFQPNGALDSTFGNNGVVITTSSSFGNIHSSDLAIDSAGTLYLSGLSVPNGATVTSPACMVVVAYGASGNVKWIQTLPVASKGDAIYYLKTSIAVQESATGPKILAVAPSWNGTEYLPVMMRLLPTGAVDTSFGTNGSVTWRFGLDRSEVPTGIRVGPRGDIVVASQSSATGVMDFGIAWWKADGSPQAGFGNQGLMLRNAGELDPSLGGRTTSAAPVAMIQPDGRVIIAGSSQMNGKSVISLMRLYGYAEDLLASLK